MIARMLVLVQLAVLVRSDLAIPAFSDSQFKTKMAGCFNNWNSLNADPTKTNVKNIIVDILKKTLRPSTATDTTEVTVTISTQPKSMAEYIMENYQAVPYHNICHGIMVSYYTWLFLAGQTIPEADAQALIFGGLMHDIGHNGFTNKYCKVPADANKKNRFCFLLKDPNADKCQADISNEAYIGNYIKNNGYFDLMEKVTGKTANDVPEKLVAKANEVLGIWSKYFQMNAVNGATPQPSSMFCESAEILHATVAKALLEKFGVPGADQNAKDKFLNLAVVAILQTHMGMYNMDTGEPIYSSKTNVSPPSNFYPLVHMSDILALGESDETLRRAILVRVGHEFITEGKLANSFLKGWYDDLGKFLESQQGFTNKQVSLQASKLVVSKNIANANFNNYLAAAQNIPYTDMISDISKTSGQSDMYKKFLADYNAIVASQAWRVI